MHEYSLKIAKTHWGEYRVLSVNFDVLYYSKTVRLLFLIDQDVEISYFSGIDAKYDCPEVQAPLLL